ncbi:MAG: amidohydrolase [Rhodoferax sp.]|nr:amidohydrolase [Rhodoferax sp.]
MRAYSDRRDLLKGIAGGLLFTGLTGLGAGTDRAEAAPPDSGAADTLFLANNILTMSANTPRVEAIASRRGRIMAVGRRADLMGLKGKHTQVVDFGDQTVLPGFVDPHMHSNFCGLRPWLDVGPFTTADMDDARRKIAQAAAQAKPGDWVLGKMLDPSIMSGQPFSLQDLDRVSPHVPVFVLESNGHVAYANTKAFELAKVTKALPDPPQGRFMRDASGELTGRLEEPPAFQPFVSVLPTPRPEEFVGFLRADLDDASKKGCTALHDCGIGGLYGEADLALIDKVMQGDPGVRYAGMLVSTHFKKWQQMGLRPGARSNRLTLNGIKAWSDGSNQGGSGYQRQPYLGSTNRGALNYTPEEIEHVIREAHQAGWQLGIHANGDAAIDVTLDAFQKATGQAGGHQLRHRIEHCSILHDDQIARMKAMGISPSFLIGHVHFWGRAFRDRLLGQERADRLDPCRSALDAGLRISLHSDYNVTPIDPLRCVQNAVLRDMREGGGILNEKERITVAQGLRAVTLDAAWQCHLDHVCGSLEPGKAADLVVLEKDPHKVAPDKIQDIRIHSTWLDGSKRFAA